MSCPWLLLLLLAPLALAAAADRDSAPDPDAAAALATDHFLRVGRTANRDNFLRFGKDGRDNFLRFGRTGKDNFLRFGKSYRDNFLRFGRAAQDNLLRFGSGDELASARAVNGLVRFGRGPSVDEGAAGAAGAQREGDALERESRAARTRSLFGRWKMADLNFIRLGRTTPSEVQSPVKRSAGNQRSSRSQMRRSDGHVDNFIRLGNGKRDDHSLAGVGSSATGNTRAKRALGSSSGQSGSGATLDCSRTSTSFASSVFGDLPLAPLSYYSPLTMGLQNYLFTPEFAFLPPGERKSKRSENRQGSNFIRLG